MLHLFNNSISRRFALGIGLLAATSIAASPHSAQAQTSVLTQRYDNERSGCNTGETTLNTSNVVPGKFGKLFSRDVRGEIYAQPLIVAGLKLPKGGARNVVFVATQSNNVYAFDADNPAAGKPLWEVNFGAPVPTRDLGSACGKYSDFSGEVGITGTPVIDAASQTIYLVSRTKDKDIDAAPNASSATAKTPVVITAATAPGAAPATALEADGERPYDPAIAEGAGFHQYLHALDITTGEERAGSPVEIKASVPGKGAGSVAGKLDFNPRIHNQRAALLLHEGFVTICWAGHCDTGPYHGWIMSYNAKTLKQSAAFCTTPNGAGAGIWLSGGGPTLDERGSMYLVTGNGTVDTDRKLARHTEFGSSVLRFDVAGGKLKVADWFTPYNYTSLGNSDLDTGSTSVVAVPGTDLITSGSKAGVLYLLDKAELGGFDQFSDQQIAQSLPISQGFLYSTPIIWKRAGRAPWLYSWGMDDRLKKFELQWASVAQTVSSPRAAPQLQFSPQPVSVGKTVAPRPGAMLTLSSNGDAPGSGIVWALSADSDANQAVSTGVLRAFDAHDLSRELWNSGATFGRDSTGYFAKFCPPVVANGKVYIASFSGQLQVYGLGGAPQAKTPTILTRSGTTKDFVTLDTDDLRAQVRYTLDGTLPTAFSPHYRTPFLMEHSQQVRARAFRDGQIASDVASSIIADADSSREGSGLIGTYFASRDLQGAKRERVDAQVANNPTLVGMGPFNWSARWTGRIKAPATGEYQISTVSDDGARLWLDDKLLIDDWNVHGETKNSFNIAMEEGQTYPVVLEYFQGENGASCQLMWTPPNGVETLIPQSQLYTGYDLGFIGNGTGLTGQYFALPNFKGLPLQRVDAQINTNPAPDGIPVNDWSARWKGEVQATRSGKFTFSTVNDDGMRLWVNGQKIVDDWNDHVAVENAGTINLEKGKKYPIVIEYYQRDQGTTYQLMWTPPGDEKTLVPTTQLYPAELVKIEPGIVGTGQGLTGSYFPNARLEGEPFVGDNQTVSVESRPVELPNLNWSARWEGELQATRTGTYTITTVSDDGVRLWLGNRQWIDDWNIHGTKENSFQIKLVAGQKYPLRLEYFQGINDAEVQLKWIDPLGVALQIPLSQLYRATN